MCALQMSDTGTAGSLTPGGMPPTGAHGRGPRLYVGGVPDEITEEDIVEHFNKWGNVVDVYFPGKKGAKRVNYCFVTYDNWRSAQRACNQSERNIDGKVRPCALYHSLGCMHPQLLPQSFQDDWPILPGIDWFVCHMQPLQSISMAEERQGEARSDDGLSGLGAALGTSLALPPALQQAAVAAMGGLATPTGAPTLGGFGPLPGMGGLQQSLSTIQTLQASFPAMPQQLLPPVFRITHALAAKHQAL